MNIHTTVHTYTYTLTYMHIQTHNILTQNCTHIYMDTTVHTFTCTLPYTQCHIHTEHHTHMNTPEMGHLQLLLFYAILQQFIV